MTDRCCAANDSMFRLPSWSISPNPYCARSVENKMRASANVIHPRSSGGNADRERASVASVVALSFGASDGAAAAAPNTHLMRLIIRILEVSQLGPVVVSVKRCPNLFPRPQENGGPFLYRNPELGPHLLDFASGRWQLLP